MSVIPSGYLQKLAGDGSDGTRRRGNRQWNSTSVGQVTIVPVLLAIEICHRHIVHQTSLIKQAGFQIEMSILLGSND